MFAQPARLIQSCCLRRSCRRCRPIENLARDRACLHLEQDSLLPSPPPRMRILDPDLELGFAHPCNSRRVVVGDGRGMEIDTAKPKCGLLEYGDAAVPECALICDQNAYLVRTPRRSVRFVNRCQRGEHTHPRAASEADATGQQQHNCNDRQCDAIPGPPPSGRDESYAAYVRFWLRTHFMSAPQRRNSSRTALVMALPCGWPGSSQIAWR